jgi:hypothetical protein
MCKCPANRTGAFCQDALRVLPLDIDVTVTLVNGDWNYFVLDLDGLDLDASNAGGGANDGDTNASSAPATTSNASTSATRTVIVEMRKVERDAFPLLYVKRGAPPTSFAGLYSPVVRGAVVTLDPEGGGRSVAVLGDPSNSRVDLSGAVPANARVHIKLLRSNPL